MENDDIKLPPSEYPLTEEQSLILKSLGEENIHKIYEIIGGTKISFKPIHDYLKRVSIYKALETTNKPIKEIAEENKVCFNTVMRVLRMKKPKKLQ